MQDPLKPMRLTTKPISISFQSPTTPITAVKTTPVIINPNQSFFFMPRKSAMAPRYGASTATSRLAKETA